MPDVPRFAHLVALGHPGSAHFAGLETFPNPGVSRVELTSYKLIQTAVVRVALTQKARGGTTITARA